MRLFILPSTLCLLASLLHAQSDSPPAPCEPWRAAYAGQAAAGKHVIALWAFDEAKPLDDGSGHGHSLSLAGAALAGQGRWGGCLESFPGYPIQDQRHQAVVKHHPALCPADAFTLEMWVKLKSGPAGYGDAFLLDKKYVAPHDYQLILRGPDKEGWRYLEACLGFGNASEVFQSRSIRIEPDQWRHVAFTYDGRGRGAFFVDGLPWGDRTAPGRRGLAAGAHNLVLGDRIGSLYHGLNGYLDQVRLCSGVREFRPARVDLLGTRTVFLRREKATTKLSVTNLGPSPLAQASVALSLDGLQPLRVDLACLNPLQARSIDYPLDTSVRPGEYRLLTRLEVGGADGFVTEEAFRIRIVARPPPDRMPVVMWGGYSPESLTREMDRLQRIGFTHVLGLGADYERIWKAAGPTQAGADDAVAAARSALDDALAGGITLAASLSPASKFIGKGQFDRIARDGKPYAKDVCALAPDLETFCYNVGASMARTYGDHPAFGAALLHTEVRDHAQACFHPHDLEAFRKATGLADWPAGAARWGADWTKIKDFPADRVIADDHPLLVWARWYWKQGDGWNVLNSALHRGLKSTGRADLWTWHDPAVRVATVYGSGGECDVISQWTYSYPDPIRIALATDELMAMAGGTGGRQQVMKMTQVIWYRSQTAPRPKTPAEALPFQADWERRQPEAPFITIAPMHLREAMWAKLSRPIRGIMYHGWQSLVPCEGQGGYRFTHEQTQHELERLVREVVRPLGPALLKAGAARADVAVLESFASQMFARRGTWGWGGSWGGNAWHALAYAHLQSEIVYDETVVQRGLEGFRVLVCCDCDVLTAPVAAKIREFQARGGIVVGDDRLCPAVKPDITLKACERTGRADADKAALLALAAELRAKLDGKYARAVDTSSPEVIPHLRRAGGGDYVFLINDRREFGQYVGQHGLVMENGLPSEATVSLARPGGAVLYDLVRGQEVPARMEGGMVKADVRLGPCDGTILLAAPKAFAQVKLECPTELARGGQGKLSVTVADADGAPVDALVPVEVIIRDAEGRRAEASGYYAATAGRLEIELDIAPNDVCGTWQVQVRELASSRRAECCFRVPPPANWPPRRQPATDAANAVQPQG